MSINKLQLKRSAVVGKIPTTASLDLGELAINTVDGKIYFKQQDTGSTQRILELTTTSGSMLSASYAQTASYSDNFNIAGTLTVQTIHVQVVTSSTELITGSLTVNGGITGSFSGSLNNLQGTPTHIPYFSSSQVLQDSSMIQIGSQSVAINQDGITTAAPEALYVWQPNTDSFNVISGKGNSNNYLQLNIQNTNQGVSASSDIVATANNGDETTNYIDMGINSQNFTGPIGDANDAYLYSTGQHLHIGNTTAGKHVGFFVGGGNHETDRKFQLNSNNQHQMTGSLDATSFISASSFITRGATAAQFVKGDGTLDSTNYLSSSVFNASSASFNAFSASMNAATASLYRATSSLYSATASLYAASASINNFTASQKVLNGTYATTASNTFYGTETVTGSVNVYGGGFNVNGVNVLDTALAYAIALG